MDSKLVIDRIPLSFNEGLFWGNGHMGALLYTKRGRVHFSVDHTGLWETRDTGGENPKKTFGEILDCPEAFLSGDAEYAEAIAFSEHSIGRTKLPGLGFDLYTSSEISGFYGETNLLDGSSVVRLDLSENGPFLLEVYLDSNINVLSLTLPQQPKNLVLTGWDLNTSALAVLKAWHYTACLQEQRSNFVHIYQPFSENGLAVMSVLQKRDDVLRIYLTLSVGQAAEADSLKNENERLLQDYASAPEQNYARHCEDWAAFWRVSELNVPSAHLQQAYCLEMYKLYCNLRQNAAPVTLQGVWNPDDRMPAWCGDWHNDLNVQACYWPAYRTGHAELAKSYIDYYSLCVPRLEERAEKLFGVKGAIHAPVMMGPMGYGAGAEWCFWNVLLGPELFIATDFSMYYEYTENITELRDKIYPFIKGVLTLYQSIARLGEDGFLHIPFTHSPEVFRDGKMICRSDATFVISTLHCLAERMVGYAKTLWLSEAAEWASFDRVLVPVSLTEKGLPLFPGIDLFESHRHFCHMFPLFPLGTETHNVLADKTLDTAINMGFTEYASWSFPYLATLASRCGRGNMAAMLQQIYTDGFRSRNSFTVNGDPNRSGVLRVSETSAGEPADTFTLEAGFIFASAMCDMFAHRAQRTVYLAAGIPDEWKTASCAGITVEGGHKLSLRIENYKLTFAEILPQKDEELSFVFFKSDMKTKTLRLTKGLPVKLI